jgi:cytochrome c oxidase subunit 2
MVVPGFVSEVRTRFNQAREYEMPCNEFCGLGHQAMVSHVSVVPKDRFPFQGLLERTSCAQE